MGLLGSASTPGSQGPRDLRVELELTAPLHPWLQGVYTVAITVLHSNKSVCVSGQTGVISSYCPKQHQSGRHPAGCHPPQLGSAPASRPSSYPGPHIPCLFPLSLTSRSQGTVGVTMKLHHLSKKKGNSIQVQFAHVGWLHYSQTVGSDTGLVLLFFWSN